MEQQPDARATTDEVVGGDDTDKSTSRVRTEITAVDGTTAKSSGIGKRAKSFGKDSTDESADSSNESAAGVIAKESTSGAKSDQTTTVRRSLRRPKASNKEDSTVNDTMNMDSTPGGGERLGPSTNSGTSNPGDPTLETEVDPSDRTREQEKSSREQEQEKSSLPQSQVCESGMYISPMVRVKIAFI